MGLLTPGYWPANYWGTNYWPDNYWAVYGVGIDVYLELTLSQTERA